MTSIPRPHPAHVPTLTEIIEEAGQPTALPASQPALAPVPVAPAKPVAPLTPVSPVAGARPAVPPMPLDALPVLGEVVSQPSPAQQDAPVAAVTEAQLAHRVLSDVQRQIDSMLEYRLKEAMAPLLARHTEAIARDLRDELNRTLKDVVARSVAQELAKLRQR